MDKYFKVPGRPLDPAHLTAETIERRERVYADLASTLPDVIHRAQSYHRTRDEMLACDRCTKVLLDVWTDGRIKEKP